MKILSVIPDLYTWGGIQKMARVINDGLSGEFEVDAVNWEATFPFSLKGLMKYLPDSLAGSVYDRFFGRYFERTSAPAGFDLIHFWHPEAALSASSILKRGFPYVVTCLGLEVLPGNLRGFRRQAYREILQGARLVHAISRYTRDLVIEILEVDPDKIRLINPPIECGLFASDSTRTGSSMVIGTLTRLQKRKNVPNIIRALEILARDGDVDLTYHLAGDGPDRRDILNQLQKVSFKWKYFGAVSEEFKRSTFYPSLDLFVMPPLDLPNEIEGFGIVYIEANALGVPVIASRTGGVEEAVRAGVSGEFADPEHPEDIARVIREMLPRRNRYAGPARRWAQKFDVSIAAGRFEELYREAEAMK